MATRSAIGIVESDGSVNAIYCHWDGYLEHVGQILVCNYHNLYLASELIDMGDASSLDKSLYSCEFYHRDRNEDENRVQARYFDNVTEYLNHYYDRGCEYFYLYIGNEWQYSTNDLNGFKSVPMSVGA
jgi:hypothetical protein